MNRGLKIASVVVLLVVAVAGGAFGFAVWLGERKFERQVLVKVVPVPYASGAAALKQGRYLFETRGCISCHGPDGSGRVMADEPNGMFIRTPNITRGPNSTVADYTEADWVRAIRHGVNPRGHALFIMPSELYNGLSDADFAALVAYLRSMPPIAGQAPLIQLPVIVKALYGLDVIRDASEKVAHARPPSAPVAVGATTEHGAYVARICMGCHGETLAGGRGPDSPPHGPEPANLTPGEGTVMTRYDTLEKFTSMLRTGKRPDGSEVRMPFEALAAFNDTDVAAMYGYLQALPPKAKGARK
jgi:cytochrome c553